MLPIQGDRTAMMQTLLPDDPEPGQELVLPEGQTVGGANVINVHKAGKLLGALNQLAPIPNVSGKYEASRLTSKLKLKKGDVIRIQGWQHNYNAIQFVESFGWIGSQTTGEPISLIDKHMRILALFPIGANTPGFYLYEKVCLEIIKGAQNGKPTTNSSPTQSRNRTPFSFGFAPPSGSSSSTRGAKTTPRERPVRRSRAENRGNPDASGPTSTSGDDK